MAWCIGWLMLIRVGGLSSASYTLSLEIAMEIAMGSALKAE
jgi:hypothetical protein